MSQQKQANGFASFVPDREAVRVGGETVYIAEMTGEEAISLKPGGDYVFRLLARCIVDEQGKRLFTDADEDVARLRGWGSRKVRKLLQVAVKLNGLDDGPEKNSDAGPSAG